MKRSIASWYRMRAYVHFDRPISVERATKLVTDPKSVTRHSFLPFISYEKAEARYRSKENKVVDKIRPIAFASHADSHIFSYYSEQLAKKLESRISAQNLNDVVLAYRRFPGGKCNVHFADAAFEEVRRRGSCVAVAIDVEKFFDSISHRILKRLWCDLLDVERLPADHYSVFRAITAYSSVNLDNLHKEFGIGRRTRRRRRMPFCTPAEFRMRVRGTGLIQRNKSSRGIPQGSPISALLSNLYMLSTDLAIQKRADQLDAVYRRYSDDILLICDESVREEFEEFVVSQLSLVDLAVNSDKTCRSTYVKDGSSQISCNRPLQYLGFLFDGKQKLIRSKTIARYQQRVRRAVRSAARAANKSARNGGNARIRRRELFERYSHLGGRNFISYAYRAADLMNDTSTRYQTRRHWRQLAELIREAESE